jgi:hypothetical protein
VCVENVCVAPSSVPHKHPAKRRVRFKVPDDGFDQGEGVFESVYICQAMAIIKCMCVCILTMSPSPSLLSSPDKKRFNKAQLIDI